MTRNNSHTILEKINGFIERNTGVFIHRVVLDNTIKFEKKYHRDHDLYEIINDIYIAYTNLLNDNMDFLICKETDQALFYELYRLREVERQIVKGNLNKWQELAAETERDGDPIDVIDLPQQKVKVQDPINIIDIEGELFSKLIPGDLEKHGNAVLNRTFFEEIIENCFNLPYFEQEAYKLRYSFPSLLNELSELSTKINPKRERVLLDSYSSCKFESFFNMTEQEIKKIKIRINEIYAHLYNFKGTELAKSFEPEGILLLQKMAYMRIFTNWPDVIKPKILKFLEDRKVMLNYEHS